MLPNSRYVSPSSVSYVLYCKIILHQFNLPRLIQVKNKQISNKNWSITAMLGHSFSDSGDPLYTCHLQGTKLYFFPNVASLYAGLILFLLKYLPYLWSTSTSGKILRYTLVISNALEYDRMEWLQISLNQLPFKGKVYIFTQYGKV